MPFIHNINPTLFEIGPFEVRFYGIVYVIGFLLVYYVLYKKRDYLEISTKDIDSYVMYLILAVIICSRLAHTLIWEPGYYLAQPLEIFYIWKGGLAFYGGLVGAVLVTYWFCKKEKVSFARFADVLVMPAVLVLALGRIANFINGELWGTVTNVPWCVEFKDAKGCRHPSQLYGSVKRFFILFILVLLNKKKHKEGFLFWSFVGLMGIGRFFVDFFREDPRFLGLSLAQYVSLVMAIVAGYVLWKYYRKK